MPFTQAPEVEGWREGLVAPARHQAARIRVVVVGLDGKPAARQRVDEAAHPVALMVVDAPPRHEEDVFGEQPPPPHDRRQEAAARQRGTDAFVGVYPPSGDGLSPGDLAREPALGRRRRDDQPVERQVDRFAARAGLGVGKARPYRRPECDCSDRERRQQRQERQPGQPCRPGLRGGRARRPGVAVRVEQAEPPAQELVLGRIALKRSRRHRPSGFERREGGGVLLQALHAGGVALERRVWVLRPSLQHRGKEGLGVGDEVRLAGIDLRQRARRDRAVVLVDRGDGDGKRCAVVVACGIVGIRVWAGLLRGPYPAHDNVLAFDRLDPTAIGGALSLDEVPPTPPKLSYAKRPCNAQRNQGNCRQRQRPRAPAVKRKAQPFDLVREPEPPYGRSRWFGLDGRQREQAERLRL